MIDVEGAEGLSCVFWIGVEVEEVWDAGADFGGVFEDGLLGVCFLFSVEYLGFGWWVIIIQIVEDELVDSNPQTAIIIQHNGDKNIRIDVILILVYLVGSLF